MTDDRLRLYFGYWLNLIIIVFAAATGFGLIRMNMDVGHGILLTAIAKIDLDWAEWAFKQKTEAKPDGASRPGVQSDPQL